MELFDTAISSTNGMFGIGLALCLIFILFVAMKRNGYSNAQAFIYSGIANFIIISLLIVQNWVSFHILMIPFAMAIVGIILSRIE